MMILQLKFVSRRWIRLLLPVLLLLVILALLGGCSGKSSPVKRTAAIKKSTRLPATQRPYVINNKKYYPIPSAEGYNEQGIASWYGPGFHGRLTSNGEVYDMHSMTAAHKTLPMDTMLLVKNLENGRQTVVRVNDRGPFVQGRIIDLSLTAAKSIGIAEKGVARVQVTALGEEVDDTAGKEPALVYEDLSVGDFYVQIGAFNARNNASRLQKRFIDAGHTAVIEQDFESSLTMYVVQVYAGKTMQLAKQAEKALQESGYSGAFIIAR
jgi:rare lipoprotein A